MMRMHTKMFLIGLGVLAIASAVRGAEPDVAEAQMPSGPTGRTLTLEMGSGHLRVHGTDGDKLRVEAVRRTAPKEIAMKDQDELRDDERSQGLTKLTNTPTGLMLYERSDGIEVLLDKDADLDVQVWVPRDATLVLSSTYEAMTIVQDVTGTVDVNTMGGVVVINATGPVKARAVFGWIRLLNVTGPVEANTDRGGIEAVLSEVSPEKPIWLTAAVGPIDVALPGEADATMTLGSTWGEIYSDFDMTLDRAPANVARLAPPPAAPAIPRGANAIDPEDVGVDTDKKDVPAPAAAPEPAPAPKEKRGRGGADADAVEAEEAVPPAEGASAVSEVPKAEKKSAASSYTRTATLAPPAPPSVRRYVGRIGAGKADIRIQTGSKNIYIRRTDEKKKK